MEQGTHENKDNAENLSRVNGGASDSSICSNVNSSYYVANNVLVLNPGKLESAGEEAGALSDISGLESIKRVADQEERCDGKEICELLNGKEVVLETATVINSGESAGSSREKKDLAAKNDELGSKGALRIPEISVGGSGNDEVFHQVEQTSLVDSGNSAIGVVLETMIVINSEEKASTSGGNGGLEVNGNVLAMNTVTVDNSKTKVSKGDKTSCVIDMCVGGGGGGFKDNLDGEQFCRICHLSSEGLLESTDTSHTANTTSMDLIHLGCGCKDELGIAHAYCAEAWFKLKGNRTCEICGETANNITAVGDNRFIMEDWNRRRFVGNSSGSSERGGGCWQGQPLCNILMACLVLSFVLPWFFWPSMF